MKELHIQQHCSVWVPLEVFSHDGIILAGSGSDSYDGCAGGEGDDAERSRREAIHVAPIRKHADHSYRLKCIDERGVAYRRSPGHFLDIETVTNPAVRCGDWIDLDQFGRGKHQVGWRGPRRDWVQPKFIALFGDIVDFEDQQGDWVRAEKGWLPLLISGKPLFEVLEAWWPTISVDIADAHYISDIETRALEKEANGPCSCLLSSEDAQFPHGHSIAESGLLDPDAHGGQKPILLTEFTSLRTPAGPHDPICRIVSTEHRGITLAQLERLLDFIQRRCAPGGFLQGWFDTSPRSPTYRQRIRSDIMNLYQVAAWIIKPATERARCSFVELLARHTSGAEAHSQRPRWFVSHAWSEPVLDFVKCVREHGWLRCVSNLDAYWVCAYANNQHELGQELVRDPKQTSFFKAMRICEGTLLVLDSMASAFTRIWCCFEEFVSLRDMERSRPMLLDICTVHEGRSQCISDGVTARDRKMKDRDRDAAEGRIKMDREAHFPNNLVLLALDVDIEKAQATEAADRRRILNCICGRPLEELDSEPLVQAQEYKQVNRSLHARFALASLTQCILQGQYDAYGARLAAALRADDALRVIKFGLSHLRDFNQRHAALLVQGIPPGLEKLDFEMDWCESFDDSGLRHLGGALPDQLQSLRLNFQCCKTLSDVGVKALAVRLPKTLRTLDLDLQMTGDGISGPGLEFLLTQLPRRMRRLRLDVAWLKRISTRSFANFGAPAKLPPRLRHLKLGVWACDAFDDQVLQSWQLPASLKSLELNLAHCKRVSDKGVASLARSLPTGMKRLQLDCYGCNFTDVGLKILAEGFPPCLRELKMNLMACDGVTALGMSALAEHLPATVGIVSVCDSAFVTWNVKQMRKLQLRIRGGKEAMDKLIDDIKSDPHKTLVRCALQKEVDVEDFARLIEALPLCATVLAIRMSECYNIVDAAGGSIVASYLRAKATQLCELHLWLTKCEKLSDGFLQSLSTAWPQKLTALTLYMSGSKHVTRTGIEYLATKLPASLRAFRLSLQYPQVESVKALAAALPTGLETLELKFVCCSSPYNEALLGDDALRATAARLRHCASLKKLWLVFEDDPSIKDEGVVGLAEALSSLKVLEVLALEFPVYLGMGDHCPHVSSVGVEALTSMLHELWHVVQEPAAHGTSGSQRGSLQKIWLDFDGRAKATPSVWKQVAAGWFVTPGCVPVLSCRCIQRDIMGAEAGAQVWSVVADPSVSTRDLARSVPAEGAMDPGSGMGEEPEEDRQALMAARSIVTVLNSGVPLPRSSEKRAGRVGEEESKDDSENREDGEMDESKDDSENRDGDACGDDSSSSDASGLEQQDQISKQSWPGQRSRACMML